VFSVQKARFPCAAWRCAFGVAKGKRQGSRVPLSFNVPYMKCGDGGAEAPASAARAHRLTARAHRLTARAHRLTARAHRLTARAHRLTARAHRLTI